MANMKKIYYYNFLPIKKEEMASMSPYQVTRTLVEIRDSDPNTTPHHTNNNNNQWDIRKKLDTQEIKTGKIHLTHDDVFEHVFRYYTLESANNIVKGKKVLVSLCDVTEDNTPMMYGPYDEQTFLMKGLNDEYVLGLNWALVQARGLKKDDEIGLYYDPRNQFFYFRLFRS